MTNENSSNKSHPSDIICFSHLRWDFVFQRPQHLMSRFGRDGRLFFIEEPVFDGGQRIDVSDRGDNVYICIPHLETPAGPQEIAQIVAPLVAKLTAEYSISSPIAWFYTPMMLHWADELDPSVIVYDCMDELSHFKGAPPELVEYERELFDRADLVFTGGQSLYEAKREQHPSVHAFPSSIDKEHFGKARSIREQEQRVRPDRPVVGFVGVIDERLDVPLLADLAEIRPDLDLVMVGPVVKIDEATLPRNENISYLGQKNYDELPGLLAGWDAAMMPFALNDSTKYISPTKTPEYLAAGLPVVSTAITDVVRPYGDQRMVEIAPDAEGFSDAIDRLLDVNMDELLAKVDEFLAVRSWDITYSEMRSLIHAAAAKRYNKAEAAH